MTTDTLRAILAAHTEAVHEAMSPWCNVKTAASYLSVSQSQIWRLKKAGKLRGYGIEGQTIVRFKREDLDYLMRPWMNYGGQNYLDPIIIATQPLLEANPDDSTINL